MYSQVPDTFLWLRLCRPLTLCGWLVGHFLRLTISARAHVASQFTNNSFRCVQKPGMFYILISLTTSMRSCLFNPVLPWCLSCRAYGQNDVTPGICVYYIVYVVQYIPISLYRNAWSLGDPQIKWIYLYWRLPTCNFRHPIYLLDSINTTRWNALPLKLNSY